MGLDMIWTGTKRSKAMYIWRRGRKAGLDTETSLWPTTDIGSGAGHVVALKENWFWNWKKYIKSQEFFNRSLQTVSGATQWLAPRPCWNLALAWKSLGNLGEKSRKSSHWSLGAGVGKGGRGRERHAVLGHREWKDGEEGGDKIVVKKKWEQVGLYKWTFDINSECWIYMQDWGK